MPADQVMREFAAGTLRSSSGQKVTNPAQARAIAASYGKEGDAPRTSRRHATRSQTTTRARRGR